MKKEQTGDRRRPISRQKCFEPSQRPRCLSFDLRNIFRSGKPLELEEEEQTQEGGRDGLQGNNEMLFGGKSRESSCGGNGRVCLSLLYMHPCCAMTFGYVSAYVTKNNSCHGNIAVRGTGIFPSESLFFLLM